jgi:branched-chain amino acid transport system ATP-binding protein
VTGAEIVLEGHGLAAGYGRRPVVHDIDLYVERGEILAILGANGAGKSTTLLALAGALPTLAGEVRLCGRPTTAGLAARARRGMGLITEERSVFHRLTVTDNLRLGRGDPARALALFPELVEHRHRRAGLLSGGQQQMLTLARALAASPAVLLVDELSLGLAPKMVGRLLVELRAAADRGTAVVLVEQHARLALDLADRAMVLRRGRCALEGSTDELRGRLDEIERTYLTGGALAASPTEEDATAAPG